MHSRIHYQLLSLKLCFSNKNHTYHNDPYLWQFYFLLIPSALCTWLPQHFILCNCWTGRFVYHLFHIAYVFRLHTFARNNNTCVQFMFVNKFKMMNPIHLERENQVSLCTCVENVCIILCLKVVLHTLQCLITNIKWYENLITTTVFYNICTKDAFTKVDKKIKAKPVKGLNQPLTDW